MEQLKDKVLSIVQRELKGFSYNVSLGKWALGGDEYIKLWFACSDININNVSGQKVQVVSYAISSDYTFKSQVFGGNGGGAIVRKPNLEVREEKWLYCKSVKVPFRQPKKTEDAVLKAVDKLCKAYKQTLIDNIEVLMYQDLVNYKELLGL